MGCLTNEQLNDGYCTLECNGSDDPSNCDMPPGGTAVTGCIVVSNLNLCALDCSGGKSCPGGMVCTMETDQNGPIEVCM
jgi:hypothetical protein